MKEKEIVLLKDIVIPAGTVFRSLNGLSVAYHKDSFEHIFGLTKDSFGSIIYSVEDMEESKEWFAEVKR